MKLYITKDGQQTGPFSLAEAQGFLAAGTIQSTDWAWYEGLAGWIPLHQVPGFAPAGGVATGASRPVFVWIISFFYFICTPFGLLGLLLIPLFSHNPALPQAQRDYFASQTYLDYGLSLLILCSNLTAAILLFMLRRPALYVFAGVFVVNLLVLAENILFKNWLEAVGIVGILSCFIGWGIQIAIIVYVWVLFKKGILR